MIIKPEPLTTEFAKKRIKEMIQNSIFFLEYGSGGSTIYASNYCKKIISVETDYNFFKKMKKLNLTNTNLIYINLGKTLNYGVPKKGETLLFINNFNNSYCKKPWHQMDIKNPDLVLIDGRYRVASALYSIFKNENNDCNYIFDDYLNRPFYHIIEKYIDITEVCDNTIIFKKSHKSNLNEISELINIYYNDYR